MSGFLKYRKTQAQYKWPGLLSSTPILLPSGPSSSPSPLPISNLSDVQVARFSVLSYDIWYLTASFFFSPPHDLKDFNMTDPSQKRRRRIRKAKLSSIQKLPAELLYQIFSSVLNDTRAFDSSSPWILAQVCSHWRSFMLSLPELWSCISIRIPNKKCIPRNAHYILETWLHRAGTDTPLSITYQCSDSGDDAQELLTTCISVCKRWEHASLHFPVSLLPYLRDVAGKLPLLRQLHLAMFNEGAETIRPVLLDGEIITAFRSAPRLRSVKIRQVSRISTSVDIPWSQLTSYDAVEYAVGDHIAVLDRIKNSVVQCKLYSEMPYHHHSSHINPSRLISCTALRKLELRNCALLDGLDAPILEHLTISDFTPRYSETLLHTFLTRSSCSLKFLDISNTMLHNEEIITVLKTAETIRDLRVWLGFEFASKFMRALTPGRLLETEMHTGNALVDTEVGDHSQRRSSVHFQPDAVSSPLLGAATPLTKSNSVRRLPSVAWPTRKKPLRTARGQLDSDFGSQSPLLPNLQHLYVNLVSCHRMNFAELVGMVEKRWGGVGTTATAELVPVVLSSSPSTSTGRFGSGGFFGKKRSDMMMRVGVGGHGHGGMARLKSLEVIATGQIATPHLVEQIRSYEAQGLDLKMHLWREWK
ncbi:hypothetical protein D9758_005542 [Tetrapyrgos nigripes]|uniref:F-box domain-containing protein n=1 Tax=Tetrapyrgos nigripes TaxID=182062 RepID=A0A8H5GGJ6_9AGAR|nr:hypothetical protein D9758_005542 [Tetrapyrgos nigripes]